MAVVAAIPRSSSNGLGRTPARFLSVLLAWGLCTAAGPARAQGAAPAPSAAPAPAPSPPPPAAPYYPPPAAPYYPPPPVPYYPYPPPGMGYFVPSPAHRALELDAQIRMLSDRRDRIRLGFPITMVAAAAFMVTVGVVYVLFGEDYDRGGAAATAGLGVAGIVTGLMMVNRRLDLKSRLTHEIDQRQAERSRLPNPPSFGLAPTPSGGGALFFRATF